MNADRGRLRMRIRMVVRSGLDRRQERMAVSARLRLICGHEEQDLSTLRWLAGARQPRVWHV